MQGSTTTRVPEPRRAAAGLLSGLLLSGMLGCASAPATDRTTPTSKPDVPVADDGPPIAYAWTDLRGQPLSAETMRGRVTVLGFIATYDVTSQAQVRFIQRLHKEHAPRLNVALVVLEKPDNRPLVEAYVNALELPFPVALADAATIRGDGPFQGLHHVPSITILDREGRERFRHLGLIEIKPLEEAVERVELMTGVDKSRAKKTGV